MGYALCAGGGRAWRRCSGGWDDVFARGMWLLGRWVVGGVGGTVLDTNIMAILVTSYYRRPRYGLATSNLSPRGFTARMGNGTAGLCAVGGTGNVRIYMAGFNNHVMSVVIPSGSNIVHSIILNFSDVTSCVDGPDSFNTTVKHCTGHVGLKRVAVSNRRVRLPAGGFNRYLRKNPRK